MLGIIEWPCGPASAPLIEVPTIKDVQPTRNVMQRIWPQWLSRSCSDNQLVTSRRRLRRDGTGIRFHVLMGRPDWRDNDSIEQVDPDRGGCRILGGDSVAGPEQNADGGEHYWDHDDVAGNPDRRFCWRVF